MYKSLINMNYNKRMFTDYKFLKTIITHYTLEKGITKYVKYLEIDEPYQDILGMYLEDEKSIILFQKTISNHCKRFTELGAIEAYNMDLLIVLFHELEHAVQTRKIDTQNDFFSKILRDNDNLARFSPRKYEKYYEHMLLEYNAQINAILELEQIDKEGLDKTHWKLTDFFERCYKYDSPYEVSKNITGIIRTIPKVSLYDKLVYGLPMEEYEKQKVLTVLKHDSSELRRY